MTNDDLMRSVFRIFVIMKMNEIRKTMKAALYVFAILFIGTYSFASFHSSGSYYKAPLKTSLQEIVTPAATAVSSNQQAVKITGIDYFLFDASFDLPTIIVGTSKAFFISLYQRNAFYTFVSIHAP